MNSSTDILREKTVHDVFTGKKTPDGLMKPLKAGEAQLYAGADHYVLRLAIFPRTRYFVKRNRDSVMAYTVYAKRFRNGDITDFDEPVGSAYLNPELKSYLEIKFPILGRSVFMSLFPSEEI